MLQCTAKLTIDWVTSTSYLLGLRDTCHATAIDTLCIGKDQLELLCKSYKSCAWVARCGDQNFRVPFVSMSIFIIDVGSGHCCVVIFQLNIMPQFCLFSSELCRQRLALCVAIAACMSYYNSNEPGSAGKTHKTQNWTTVVQQLAYRPCKCMGLYNASCHYEPGSNRSIPSSACLTFRLCSYAVRSLPSRPFLYKYSFRSLAFRRIMRRGCRATTDCLFSHLLKAAAQLQVITVHQ